MNMKNELNEINFNAQQGWQCPICKTVMAPWQIKCINCSSNAQPLITYEPAPWWANPNYRWDITCNATSTQKSNNPNVTVTTWNNAPSTNTLQNALKSAKLLFDF